MAESSDKCEQVSPSCPVDDTTYGYAPNPGANGFYAAIFAICSLAQLYFLLRHWILWKGYTLLVLVGSVGECCGYVGRLLLHTNPWDGAALSIQFLLLMVSPSLLAAALYMTLRTLVQFFGPEHTRLPARLWTWPFVTADLIGFVAQCSGGIVASMGDERNGLGTAGNIIMMAGVTFQAAVMAVAGGLAADFALRLRQRASASVFGELPRDLKIFLFSITVAFLLILVRCIYRIPELSGGVGGPLMRKETDFMVLDGCMILLSVILLSAVHPGIFASATQDSRVRTYKTMGRPGDAEYGHEMLRSEPRHERRRTRH